MHVCMSTLTCIKIVLDLKQCQFYFVFMFLSCRQFEPKRSRIVIDFSSINHSGMNGLSGLEGMQSP